MPGPLSRPDGNKETEQERQARASQVVVSGKTARKRSRRKH